MGSIALPPRDETFNLQRELAFQGMLGQIGCINLRASVRMYLLLLLTRHLRAWFRLLFAQNGTVISHA